METIPHMVKLKNKSNSFVRKIGRNSEYEQGTAKLDA
jgi:hypothetical protein